MKTGEKKNPKTSAIERLEELLAGKDAELEEAMEKCDRLERELEGALDGWRALEEFPDDGELPTPRLELTYRQRAGSWSSYYVTYRLVYRHLLGQLVGVPLSRTKIDGPSAPPEASHLPFRDGAHAAHDAKHLGLPAYKIVPGEEPREIDFSDYASQRQLGLEHRRRELE